MFLLWTDIIISDYNKSNYAVLDENVSEIFSAFVHDFTVVLDDVNIYSHLMRSSKELRGNLKQLSIISESCKV